MSTLTGRYITATKNTDGTVTLECGHGTENSSQGLMIFILASAEVTSLAGVCSGGAGTKAKIVHTKETAPIGYHN